MAADPDPTIWVVAGPNGGGKSSIVGELIRQTGADYFNPDEYTVELAGRNPGLPVDSANELAWREGKRRLEEAVERRRSFAFETTLGGRTITRLLLRAAGRGIAVKIWYIALDSADRHVARVKERAARGGHDIPEERIRSRYDQSRANLMRLIPLLSALKAYDNSYEVGAGRAGRPRPKLVLDFADGRIRNRRDIASAPRWAKSIVAAALKAEMRPSGRR